MHRALGILMITAGITFCQCSGNIENSADQNQQDSLMNTNDSTRVEVVKPDPVEDTLLTQYAQILAGVDTVAYKSLGISAQVYQAHQSRVKTDWDELDTKILSKMRNWIKNEQLTNKEDSFTVFYPFGGPDYLFADIFYPFSHRFIMGGLEHCGSVADLTKMSNSQLQLFFSTIRNSIYVPNKVGFFKTNNMKTDLKSTFLNGVVHILLFYIAKTGYVISDLETIYVNAQGKLLTEKPKTANPDDIIDGIRIKYFNPDDKIEKEVIYFSFDLSDGNVEKHKNFLTFLDQYGEKNILLKSASYLLHKPYFSLIRDNALTHARKVIQDDTGFPYRYFNNDNWNVQLYGTYSKTIALFSNMYQKDYRAEFVSGKKVKPIDFKIGYNTMHGECNFLYAVRKASKELK